MQCLLFARHIHHLWRWMISVCSLSRLGYGFWAGQVCAIREDYELYQCKSPRTRVGSPVLVWISLLCGLSWTYEAWEEADNKVKSQVSDGFQVLRGRTGSGKQSTQEVQTSFCCGHGWALLFCGEKMSSGSHACSLLPLSSCTPHGKSAVCSQAWDSITFIVRLGYDCL